MDKVYSIIEFESVEDKDMAVDHMLAGEEEGTMPDDYAMRSASSLSEFARQVLPNFIDSFLKEDTLYILQVDDMIGFYDQMYGSGSYDRLNKQEKELLIDRVKRNLSYGLGEVWSDYMRESIQLAVEDMQIDAQRRHDVPDSPSLEDDSYYGTLIDIQNHEFGGR